MVNLTFNCHTFTSPLVKSKHCNSLSLSLSVHSRQCKNVLSHCVNDSREMYCSCALVTWRIVTLAMSAISSLKERTPLPLVTLSQWQWWMQLDLSLTRKAFHLPVTHSRRTIQQWVYRSRVSFWNGEKVSLKKKSILTSGWLSINITVNCCDLPSLWRQDTCLFLLSRLTMIVHTQVYRFSNIHTMNLIHLFSRVKVRVRERVKQQNLTLHNFVLSLATSHHSLFAF